MTSQQLTVQPLRHEHSVPKEGLQWDTIASTAGYSDLLASNGNVAPSGNNVSRALVSVIS